MVLNFVLILQPKFKCCFSEETQKTSTRKQKVTTGRLCIISITYINLFSEETEGLLEEGKKKTSARTEQKVTAGRMCTNSINLLSFFQKKKLKV